MKWILNIVYVALLALLSPVILWRSFRHGRYRQGWKAKLFGNLPVFAVDEKVVWFHAVSVGEVLQLQKVVTNFQRHAPPKTRILITTSTDTGFELATSRFPDCSVSWFPLDFSWAVSNAIRRVNPHMVVLVELELWPNFLRECANSEVSTTLINARMSDRSYRGYSRIRRLVAPLLHQFSVIAAQNEEYADRLIGLGARPDVVTVTGSVKFDGVCSDREGKATLQLAELFGLQQEDTVFIAGSTQHPEEQLALKAWKSLRKDHADLRLILVPRHRERFDDVAAMVSASGCKLSRRSTITTENMPTADSVILLDTIGELTACWGLADVAFVGGSFGPRGGQNMLEPAAYGAAIMVGPNTSNFKEIVHQLLQAKGIIQLQSEPELQTKLYDLVDSPLKRSQLGQAAKATVLSQQGAVDRTVKLLEAVLNPENSGNNAVVTQHAA